MSNKSDLNNHNQCRSLFIADSTDSTAEQLYETDCNRGTM